MGSGKKRAAGVQARKTRRRSRDRCEALSAPARIDRRAQQPPGIRMQGLLHEIDDGARFNKASGIHDGDAICDFRRDAEVVGHEDDPHPQLALKPPQQEQNSNCTVASSAVVGSSANNNSGRQESAIAIMAR